MTAPDTKKQCPNLSIGLIATFIAILAGFTELVVKPYMDIRGGQREIRIQVENNTKAIDKNSEKLDKLLFMDGYLSHTAPDTLSIDNNR